MKWETRQKWAEPLKIVPVPEYTPPYPVNPDNPQCFFEMRAGGYYLGRIVFEVKEDVCPTTAASFIQLCEYHCYAASMFLVYPGNWIRVSRGHERENKQTEPSPSPSKPGCKKC